MKEILFDVSALGVPHISGVGIYVQSLFWALRKLEDSQDKWILRPVLKHSRFRKRSLALEHLGERPQFFWPLLSSRRNQIFHGPDFQIPANVRGAKIVTIHDLAFYETGMTSPDFAQKKIAQMEHLITKQKPDAILTVSDYTRQTLLERFPQLQDRVFVSHLGHEHLVAAPTPAPEISNEPPFFLFVGNLEERKNVARLLEAFERFCENSKGTHINLILVGRPGYGYSHIESVLIKMKYKSRVILLGHVSNSELKRFYQKAIAFIYPSLIEGFGLPLVEAMLEGCPIVTANRTSTKEVAGSAALLIDPFDVESIERGMIKIASSSELRQKLVEIGRWRVKDFSWAQCAQNTLRVYQQFF